MYKSILLITLIFGFSSCAKQEPIYTSKKYININKNAVLNAAKKVIKLSDKRFNIESSINSIRAKRIIISYKAFDADLQINTIHVQTKKDENSTIAKLKIIQKIDYFDEKEKIITNDVHKLFWKRVDYILGLTNNWTSCLNHNLNLNFDGILCNKIYNQNNQVSIDDKIQENIGIHKKILKKDIKISNIDLKDLKDINMQFNESNTSIQEINLEQPVSETNKE